MMASMPQSRSHRQSRFKLKSTAMRGGPPFVATAVEEAEEPVSSVVVVVAAAAAAPGGGGGDNGGALGASRSTAAAETALSPEVVSVSLKARRRQSTDALPSNTSRSGGDAGRLLRSPPMTTGRPAGHARSKARVCASLTSSRVGSQCRCAFATAKICRSPVSSSSSSVSRSTQTKPTLCLRYRFASGSLSSATRSSKRSIRGDCTALNLLARHAVTHASSRSVRGRRRAS
mmetsp:Transcript_12292/g.49519  ORF Transcript_12292/g.49519 Transcript_12292/m.49519 type:complete len:231 (+) Transcript_12292:691-1383(+)